MSETKLSERIRQKYCIFDEVVEPVYPNELKGILQEVEALEAEVKTLKAKADELDDLKDPMKPFGITGDFGAAMQEHLKFEEAKARLAKAQELVEKWRSTEKSHNGVKCHAWKVCADELEEILE
jgi:hypothetical protein